MELQHSHGDFERAGVAVFAISYDSVDVLASFTQRHGITYPLLSDEGSRVIRALGLYNEHSTEQHSALGVELKPHHYGVPYPGAFLLDDNGVIVDKRFEQNYRARPSPVSIIEGHFERESSRTAASAQAHTEQLRVDARLGQATYRPNQVLRLNIDIQIAPGLHVYGQPIPEGYTPLSLDIEPFDGLVVGEPELPPARPFHVEGLDEQFHTYEGTIRAALPLVITQNLGETTLAVDVRYQACSHTDCFPPDELRLGLTLQGLEPVRD